jgi:hypothetical protein
MLLLDIMLNIGADSFQQPYSIRREEFSITYELSLITVKFTMYAMVLQRFTNAEFGTVYR